MPWYRREFVQQSLSLMIFMAATNCVGKEFGAKSKTILLRSSWQTVNIGDIGHTPGALEVFKQYLPDNTRLILWPSSVDNGVAEMLKAYFPKLVIAEGKLDEVGKPSTPALQAAFKEADIFVHGSGPMVLAQSHMEAWRKLTGKPYGVFGVTIGGELDGQLTDLLNGAAFVYLRDTVSLKQLQQEGIKSPVLAFGPDATFAIPLRNKVKAQAYLNSVGLTEKQFICVIPRLRYTPYFKIHNTTPTAEELRRAAISEQFVEQDHAKLREVIIEWVRKTGLKVLACPEMTHEMALAKQYLVDPLPDDVKKNVVWRETYWLPDEATSVYERSRAVVSLEMHSPIMAFQANVPAILVRQPTDTSKGQMWRDVGLADWIFEVDTSTGAQIASRVLEIHGNYPVALAKLGTARGFVKQRQQEMAGEVAKVIQT
ncbi:polysaccharide pyruvyl transferase family protein [Hymenobacter terrenus]|uniref:polysaccharide pyruvyl transferase family protein n=1 Tax=Hymenobacter terrenus TaxID=1629124 RepID=UPI00069829FA|nr:polysaccharide pyruvyl transferase family protein [Hymenobacter terrenus]